MNQTTFFANYAKIECVYSETVKHRFFLKIEYKYMLHLNSCL